MPEEAIYGWLVTVEQPDGAASKVYNVAIREERLAIAAVKRVVRDPEKAVIKIKSKLTKQLFEALKMQAGDVMLGARKKRHRGVNCATRATLRTVNAAKSLGSVQGSHSRTPQKSRTTG